jgi:hypothetical protein
MLLNLFTSSHSKSIFGFYRQYTIDQHVRLNFDRHAEAALNRVEAGHSPGSSVFIKYPFVYTRQVAAGKGDDRHVAQPADLEELPGLLFVASFGAIVGWRRVALP